MEPKTSVLLGAGASVDAGLPLTVELAERIVEQANQDSGGNRGREDWVSALNFAYGAMVGYQAEDGGNPLQAVNIERLISALRLLQNANDHEVAPFVAGWKAGALGVGTSGLDSSLGGSLVSAIQSAAGERHAFTAERQVVDGVARIARAATTRGNPGVFRIAEERILHQLSRILGDLGSVEYLSPLADLARKQSAGLDVITLNYDLAVEKMAADTGIDLERGLGIWAPGAAMTFPSKKSRINLFKLHGSLDWVEREPGNGMTPPRIEDRSSYERETPAPLRSSNMKPWIVVGDREKLATDGPTLALLRAAEEALQSTSHLVVIGYSFSDAHINSLIRNWMLERPERTIGVIDTRWDPGSLGDFREALIHTYGSSQDRASRVLPLVGTTKSRLAEALHRMPDKTPEPYGSIKAVEETGDVVRISLDLHGPDLYKVALSTHGPSHLAGIDTFKSSSEVGNRPQQQNSSYYASFDQWVQGSEIEVFVRAPLANESTISIRGKRLDGAYYEEFKLSVASSTRGFR